MLRVSLCVVFVHVALGLGVDDTEKRRSEEILRAVAAAATADYEGLQQMKYQKATTGSKITGTAATASCISALSAALTAEKLELQKSVSTTSGKATTDSQDVTTKTTALKTAIATAIQEVYGELLSRYKAVSVHAADMEAALKAELADRTTDVSKRYRPEVLFETIMTNAAQQLNSDGKTVIGDGSANSGMYEQLGGALKEMMLETVRDNALASKYDDGTAGDRTETQRRNDEHTYIQVENLLNFAGNDDASTYANFNANRSPNNNGRGTGAIGSQTGKALGSSSATTSGEYDAGKGSKETAQTMGTGKGNGDKFYELERTNFLDVEAKFIAWTVAKSNYHNTSTKKTALDAAKAMVQKKIDAVSAAVTSVTSYTTELKGLEDDEMRKIHDIKEEFESLAADWLQLATYHCCDIVQGNAIECDDATAHLIAPINTVFPNALRKPNVQTDCTRRLL